MALVRWLSEAQLWAGFPEMFPVARWLRWLPASYPCRVHRQGLFPGPPLIRTKESLSWKSTGRAGSLSHFQLLEAKNANPVMGERQRRGLDIAVGPLRHSARHKHATSVSYWLS